jgi:hypothetical protein
VFRVAVSYYLILALSAGPAFCCCALKSIAAPIHAVAAKTTSPAQADDACPHCKKHQGEKPLSPENSPAPENRPQDGCPCKDHGPAAALPDAVPDHARAWSSADNASLVLSLDAVGILSADFAAPARPCALAGLRAGPWLTAGDLLSTHHVIRC